MEYPGLIPSPRKFVRSFDTGGQRFPYTILVDGAEHASGEFRHGWGAESALMDVQTLIHPQLFGREGVEVRIHDEGGRVVAHSKRVAVVERGRRTTAWDNRLKTYSGPLP